MRNFLIFFLFWTISSISNAECSYDGAFTIKYGKESDRMSSSKVTSYGSKFKPADESLGYDYSQLNVDTPQKKLIFSEFNPPIKGFSPLTSMLTGYNGKRASSKARIGSLHEATCTAQIIAENFDTKATKELIGSLNYGSGDVPNSRRNNNSGPDIFVTHSLHLPKSDIVSGYDGQLVTPWQIMSITLDCDKAVLYGADLRVCEYSPPSPPKEKRGSDKKHESVR